MSNRAYLMKKVVIESIIVKYKSGKITSNKFLKSVSYY